MVTAWRPGDRVLLSPTGLLRDWTSGVVLAITPRGSVSVRLTRTIRGVRSCTASPKELLRVPER